MKKKILIIKDGGGFALETKRLISGYDSEFNLYYLVPQDNEMNIVIESPNTYGISKVTAIYNNSKLYKIVSFSRCFFQVLKILKNEKFHCIIGIGSSVAVPVFLAAKLFGVKTLFIESITRVTELSKTAKMLLRFNIATKTFVQWESLADKYPKVEFKGNIL